MRDVITLFTSLGARLSTFGNDESSAKVLQEAIAANNWFTKDDIRHAAKAICNDMLTEEHLEAWLSRYPIPAPEVKRVAVIMAGNIPLVGFFDLLCVVASGHECHVKMSSKDSVLMGYIIELLRNIEPEIPIFEYSSEESYDMAIATGGDDANRYFREHFATTRTLLRGSRHSIAVLDGRESDEELAALFNDITRYSGLGCRSVSLLFTPRGTMPNIPSAEAKNSKLRRNIASTRALLAMEGREMVDCGAFIMLHNTSFAESLAIVSLCEYDNLDEVRRWIEEHRDTIQCIVSHTDIEHCVAFGKAQHPMLWDYADGIDTMKFLLD